MDAQDIQAVGDFVSVRQLMDRPKGCIRYWDATSKCLYQISYRIEGMRVTTFDPKEQQYKAEDVPINLSGSGGGQPIK